MRREKANEWKKESGNERERKNKGKEKANKWKKGSGNERERKK